VAWLLVQRSVTVVEGVMSRVLVVPMKMCTRAMHAQPLGVTQAPLLMFMKMRTAGSRGMGLGEGEGGRGLGGGGVLGLGDGLWRKIERSS
jgi:hypothetical protein